MLSTPIIPDHRTRPVRESSARPAAEAATRGREKNQPVILVVEDDPSIRHFICAVLKYATAWRILDAPDPYAALLAAHELGRPIQLLVCDVDLSTAMDGAELAHALAEEHPEMKVLLMSAGDGPRGEVPADWLFLAKPFPIAAFLECVHALCDPALPPDPAATLKALFAA